MHQAQNITYCYSGQIYSYQNRKIQYLLRSNYHNLIHPSRLIKIKSGIVLDFFEMESVLDELARSFAAPSATTWFKVASNKKPTRDDYRKKVVEFMNLFEASLSSGYQDIQNSKELLDSVKKGVKDQTTTVLSGNNKEVEKRYRYYVDYG